jgi:hypothetical protein
MANDYFNASGTPAQSSSIVSPNVRAEFAGIAAGFDKMPALTGNAYEVTYINASGTAMASVGGDGLLKLSTTGVPTIAAAGTDYTNLAVLSAATAATPNDTDLMPVVDAGVTKKLSLTNLKAFLKTYFDTLYTTASAVAGYVSGLIGSTIQAYDADTAKLDVAQSWAASQRGTITTDNDGSFNQSVTNNFKCTPTATAALTFTNHTAGQSGLILFVNGSNYAITAAATTYIAAADLVKLSATGTYLVAYLDNGTNAYCTVTAKLTSAGV